jgi:glycosyltransferase involved in cell wall biosynthesis
MTSERRPPITVTILTRDEESKLPACLASAAWADEILVLDSGSSDRTVEIARAAGATVHRHEWLGFAAQKNRAATLAQHDWILNLDADERVGKDLAAAIETGAFDAATYTVRRVSDFMGLPHRAVHRPREERLVRLYDRRRASFPPSLVHEKVVEHDGSPPSSVDGTIYHEGFRDLEDMVARLNRYSTLLAAESTRPATMRRLAGRPTARFLWAMFRHRNVLDGRRGLLLSGLWAFHDLLVEGKRLETQLGPSRAFEASLFAAHEG